MGPVSPSTESVDASRTVAVRDRAARWFLEPVPLARVAVFRTLVYLFLVYDVLVRTPWVRGRSGATTDLYRPLLVGRLLHLPTPTPTLLAVVMWSLVVGGSLLAVVRLPRRTGMVVGWVVACCYFEWMVVAMSYGKVDHDRFGFLLALFVLPSVGVARHGDLRPSEAAGWAMRMVQIGAVATYFLSFVAKMRFAGLRWPTSSVMAWALVRRGSDGALRLAQVPHVLVVSQFVAVVAEALSPLLFVLRGRWRYVAVGACYLFHLVVVWALGISFGPHLVTLLAFLPLEVVRPSAWVARLRAAVPDRPSTATSR